MMRVAFETRDGLRAIESLPSAFLHGDRPPERIKRPETGKLSLCAADYPLDEVKVPMRVYRLSWVCPEWMKTHCEVWAIYREET